VPWEGLSKGLSDGKTEVACSTQSSSPLLFLVLSIIVMHLLSSWWLVLVADVKDRILRHRVQPCLCQSPWLNHNKLLWVLWFSPSQFRMSILKTPQTWFFGSA